MAAQNSGFNRSGEGPGALGARLPVVTHYDTPISAKLEARLAALAENIRKQVPNLASTEPFGDRVRPGLENQPSLVIEDHSWIELFETLGDISYGYRACTLAGDDDLVAVDIARCPAFEDYCRNTLGLGNFEIATPCRKARRESLAVRCARNSRFVGHAAAKARASNGLNIVPYMGTGGVWLLAAGIAEASGRAVHVAAPPPQLTRRTNDKLWFARVVREALGGGAQPRSFEAYGLAAMVLEASILARKYAAIAIKLPASASSAGNLVLNGEDIAGKPPGVLRAEIDARLRRIGWRGGYPLMVTAWESPVLSSPSIQLWIPRRAEGDVVIEGIFDQQLTGRPSEFCGAMPSALSRGLRQRLADEAAALGFLFQMLGYFGRCSFDSIVLGESEDSAEVHWIECNGRWGGTSIPMTLANRLVGDWSKSTFVVAERGDFVGPPWRFEEFRDDMDDMLFKRSGPPYGLVVLSPSRIEAGTGYELLALAPCAAEARRSLARVDEAFRARTARPSHE